MGGTMLFRRSAGSRGSNNDFDHVNPPPTKSPANDANILCSTKCFQKETQEEQKPGEIKISKCSLRKRVNPLQHGSIQEAVRVRRR